MDELVSGVIRRSDFSVKNEEEGQRVKRRRVERKRHFDGGWAGGWMQIQSDLTRQLDDLRSLNTILEPSGANDTVSRA